MNAVPQQRSRTLDERQTDSQTVFAAVAMRGQPVVLHENLFEMGLRDAAARVLHLDRKIPPTPFSSPNRDGSFLRVFDGIADQVVDDLLEQRRIGLDTHP